MASVETIPIINGPPPKAENMSGVQFDIFCKFLLDRYMEEMKGEITDENQLRC